MQNTTINENKEEYENFNKANKPKIKQQDLAQLRKKLKEETKQRQLSQKETNKLKNKVNALKNEEDKALKKLENTKKTMIKLESVRKNLLANKIQLEEFKSLKEKQLQERKNIINEQNKYNKYFLKNWKVDLSTLKQSERKELKTQQIQLSRTLIKEKQEEEDKNKQLCIKVKTSKINFEDKKKKIIEQKRKEIKKDILNKIKREKEKQNQLKYNNTFLYTEENELKKNLAEIESSNIDECKSIKLYFII